jgi:uncharacterized SAM-binding protein YcdF (DUF218 family)
LSLLITTLLSPLGVGFLLAVGSLYSAYQAQVRLTTLARGFGYPGLPARKAWWLGALALAWLWAWSTPLVSDALRGHLENQAGPRTLQDVAPAPMVLVMASDPPGHSPERRWDQNPTMTAEQLQHAARIYHTGKARQLLLAGVPTAHRDDSEAEAVQHQLEDLGVPAFAIGRESRSPHMATNARYAAQRLQAQGIDTVILVAPALHMPLARWLLEREGLTVQPAPTGFEVASSGVPLGWQRLLPNAEALDGSTRAFQELTARWLLL